MGRSFYSSRMKQTVLQKGPEARRRILLGLMFLTPLLFLRSAYDPFNMPKLWLVMVGVAVVAAIRAIEILQGAERSGLRLVAMPAAAVAGSLLVGTLLSPHRVWSLIGDHFRYTGFVPYLVVIAAGVLVADAFRRDARPLAWVLATSGAVAGGYAVIQVAGLDPFEWSVMNLGATTLGNTNFSGAFFAICLPVAVSLVLVEREKRLLVAGCIVLIGAGWIISQSEAAWAAGVAGVVVLAGCLLASRWPPARLIGLAAAGLIGAAGVGFVVVAMTDEPPGSIPESIRRRAEWWEASSRMVATSPLFGRGPNSFAIEHTHHRDIEDVAAVGFEVTDDPHSLLFSLATAAGLLGVVAFLIFTRSIVVNVLKVGPGHVIGIGFAGAATAYLVQSLLSVDVIPLRFVGWTALGASAAAIAPVVSSNKVFAEKKKKKSRKIAEPLDALPAVAAIILTAGGGIAWATGLLFADIAFQRGLSPASGGASAQENFRSAIAFRETNDTYRREYGSLLGANATRQALEEGGDEEVARQFLQEAEQALSFVEHFPHANSVLVYARVMRDWAQVDASAEARALELYERAAELDPYNFRIFDEAAAAALTFGRDELALELRDRSSDLQQSAED